jgi:hypothetical protein
MQYGVATYHPAFRGDTLDQAFGTDRGMQEKLHFGKFLKEAEEHLMPMVSHRPSRSHLPSQLSK